MVAHPAFRHDLVRYHGREELRALVVTFIEEGLSSAEPVVLQLPDRTWRTLAHDLMNLDALLRNPLASMCLHPHQALWGLRQLIAEDLQDAKRIRVVSEIDFRAGADLAEWSRVEATMNESLCDLPVWCVCLAHSSQLSDSEQSILLHTHPAIRSLSGTHDNPGYQDPRAFLRGVDSVSDPDPLEARLPFAETTLVTGTDLRTIRLLVERALEAARVSRERSEDFLTAVFEVATNALLHGGTTAAAVVWALPDQVLCRIRDDGPGLSDPLTGYEPPLGRVEPGSGLWTARQLCDRMTTTMEPQGFTVRLHLYG